MDSGATASYDYDYANRRFRKSIGPNVTHYIWDDYRVIAEHNGLTGAQIIDYVFYNTGLIGEGTGSSFTASSPFTYELSDGMSERASIDNAGNLIGRQGHLPYGEEFGETGAQEKHHLGNYENDPETGSDYAINRQYFQSLSRFGRVDPKPGSIHNPQTLNRYAFVAGDPIDHRDPLGLEVTVPFLPSTEWLLFAGDCTLWDDRGNLHGNFYITCNTPSGDITANADQLPSWFTNLLGQLGNQWNKSNPVRRGLL